MLNIIKSFFGFQKPIIKPNTFFIWEPCSQNHAEVVPGYAKYLLDLGYNVSVFVDPDRYKEGLFARLKSEKLFLNFLDRKQTKKYFKTTDLNNVEGVLVTTAGKLCIDGNYDKCLESFGQNVDKKKIFLVEHDIKPAVDKEIWNDKIITLRKMDYKNAKSVVINPHYFGDIKITPKNKDIVNFITIGALKDYRRSNDLIIDSVKVLHEKGYRNFKITVVGKGKLKGVPKNLHKYFDIKGRLPFSRMYDEIEKADFILTSYSKKNDAHQRYITTGTSGNFQLVYGFLKLCIILEEFGTINEYDSSNSIVYNSDEDYAAAMIKGIEISQEEYLNLQNNLKRCAEKIYQESLENLKNLIASGGIYK